MGITGNLDLSGNMVIKGDIEANVDEAKSIFNNVTNHITVGISSKVIANTTWM